MSEPAGTVFGIVAEFDSTDAAAAAAHRLQEGGWRRWDAYGPAPLPQLVELADGGEARALTAVMVAAAVAGAGIGYFLQYWNAVYGYPINVGGRPDDGGPGFIPSAWEICALCTVWAGLVALLIRRRLPRLYHPLFAAPGFERASQDRWFLCVERCDPAYDVAPLSEIFRRHGALAVTELRETLISGENAQ